MNPAPRILVTGASGQLGRRIVALLATRSVACLGTHRTAGEQQVAWDLANDAPPEITAWRPTLIIHCAALTNVDACERVPETAWAVNAGGTSRVCALARAVGARLVYMSTDSVFDGEHGCYRDDATPSPLNVYAQTKLAGEHAAAHLPNALVVRGNILGPYGLTNWILNTARAGAPVPVFTDVIFNPLDVDDLAGDLIALGLSPLTGLVHVGSDVPMSKADYAERLLVAAGLTQVTSLERMSVDAAAMTATRPKNTSLEPSAVVRTLLGPRSIDAGVLRYVRSNPA